MTEESNQEETVATKAKPASASNKLCAEELIREFESAQQKDDLPEIYVGDTVRVVRGDYAHGGKRVGGKRNADPLNGKVLNVESNTGRIFVEGATATKSDNREEAVPVHSSNVVVTKLDETDKLRMQHLTADRS